MYSNILFVFDIINAVMFLTSICNKVTAYRYYEDCWKMVSFPAFLLYYSIDVVLSYKQKEKVPGAVTCGNCNLLFTIAP